MADSRTGSDDSESVGDNSDDGQLRIRIPNPKVYMARQSQWKGRRGKPRCDHCRINNLKCDRVLPTCNHCSWANGRDCRYTPLPTPAHRGIPRCDRCREKNLKCDRNLPVCNHCVEDETVECNYTPKKRHKVPLEQASNSERQMAPYGTKAASFLVSDMSVVDDLTKSKGDPERHSFYGQNIASTSRFVASPSPSTFDRANSNEKELPRMPASGQYTPEFQTRVWSSHSQPTSTAPKATSGLSFIAHSFTGEQGMLVSRSVVDPWSHPSFTSLPPLMLQRLSTVNSVEMPNRQSFWEAFGLFLGELMPELLETAAFGPEVYAKIWRALSKGDTSKLSERLRLWLSYHHVRIGSEKTCLLIMPRDKNFGMGSEEEERQRQEYIDYIDGKGKSPEAGSSDGAHAKESLEHGLDSSEWSPIFERIPVMNQIFDILVYCHRAHGSSSTMLYEARRLGMATITWPMVETFVRLCPLCNLRGKPVSSLSGRPDADGSRVGHPTYTILHAG